jgi:hypothetical protein
MNTRDRTKPIAVSISTNLVASFMSTTPFKACSAYDHVTE